MNTCDIVKPHAAASPLHTLKECWCILDYMVAPCPADKFHYYECQVQRFSLTFYHRRWCTTFRNRKSTAFVAEIEVSANHLGTHLPKSSTYGYVAHQDEVQYNP